MKWSSHDGRGVGDAGVLVKVATSPKLYHLGENILPVLTLSITTLIWVLADMFRSRGRKDNRHAMTTKREKVAACLIRHERDLSVKVNPSVALKYSSLCDLDAVFAKNDLNIYYV